MKQPKRIRLFSLLFLAAAGMQGHVAGDPLLKGDPVRGKAYFDQTCASCHAAALGPDNKPIGGIGPSLVGVVGRRGGFDLNNVILNPPTLDKYLTNPDSFGPDVEMPISVNNATDRADVIAYLATLKMPKSAPVPAASSSAGNQTSPKP
jgi:cytochrome c2